MPWKKIIHILDKTTIYFSKNTDLLFKSRIILYILSNFISISEYKKAGDT